MELQQSNRYASYIRSLHWQVLTVDGVRMFYRHIPLAGGLLKIQRPHKLPNVIKLVQEHHVRTVAIEPIQTQDNKEYKTWCGKLQKYCRVVRSDYMPTKTILVDVTPREEEIFRRFSEAKRRAVRRAQKNGVTCEESSDIQSLIRIKNKAGGWFGFITTTGIDKLWPIMYPDHATTVLAYTKNHKLVGGVLVLFWNKTAYYWIAGATREGKKLFAPTLLVWEVLRVAKKRGCRNFDFVGVWDERRPREHHDWLGFTKFKEGFGGKSLYYPIS